MCTYKSLPEICRNPLVESIVVRIEIFILLDEFGHPLSQRIFDVVRRTMTMDSVSVWNSEQMDALSCTKIWRECVAILIDFAWVLWLVSARCCKCKLGDHILSPLSQLLFLLILSDLFCRYSNLILRPLLQKMILQFDFFIYLFHCSLIST